VEKRKVTGNCWRKFWLRIINCSFFNEALNGWMEKRPKLWTVPQKKTKKSIFSHHYFNAEGNFVHHKKKTRKIWKSFSFISRHPIWLMSPHSITKSISMKSFSYRCQFISSFFRIDGEELFVGRCFFNDDIGFLGFKVFLLNF
jgi:hypothetical protein